MNRIVIEPIVIVEGKYDKIVLSNVIDAVIIPCDGFEIFKNKKQKQAIRDMALEHGAIVLTDSDSAGALIRSHLSRILQGCTVYMLYTPAVRGKERRKTDYSKEGLLGVEGMDVKILRQLFEEFRTEPIQAEIFAHHLFEYGFSGCDGAKQRRLDLLDRLRLSPHLSNNALLKELNRRFTLDEFKRFVK